MSNGKITIDLEDYAFDKTAEETKEGMRDSFGEIIEPVIEKLEEFELFEWFNVMRENKDEVTNLDNTIGTEDLDLESIVNKKGLYQVLLKDERTDWIDPMSFSSVFYGELAEIVSEQFDSDEEFINYLKERMESEEEKEELEDTFEELKENAGEGMLDLFVDTSDYELDIAKSFSALSGLVSMGLTQFWNDRPDVGQYIVFDVTKDYKMGKIVLKVVDIETEDVLLSEIAEDVSKEEDMVLDTLDYIVVENVAYDDSVLDMYENHHLLQDVNETNRLGGEDESQISKISDENPLPLD